MKSRIVLLLLLIPHFIFHNNKPISSRVFQDNSGEVYFAQLDQEITQHDFGNINRLIILQDDKTIFDKAHNGHQKNEIQCIQSVSKSITSLIVGIALKKNMIRFEDNITNFFPEYKNIFLSAPQWNDVTVDDLLNMTAGYEWYEDRRPEKENPVYQMNNSENPVKYIFERPFFQANKKQFNYCSGCVVLLSTILSKITNNNLREFAEVNLFTPLEIDNYHWVNFRNGLINGAGGLYLSAEDMAKTGLLFLNNGRWRNKEIIDSSYFNHLKNNLVEVSGYADATHYTQLWWVNKRVFRVGEKTESETIYSANGYGDQHIIMIPNRELVIVITGSNNGSVEKKYLYTRIVDEILKLFGNTQLMGDSL